MSTFLHLNMLLGGTDYTRLTPRPLTLRRNVPPPSVTLTTNGDQISQEGDEDFFLQLSVLGALPSNLFLRDMLRIVIRDGTGLLQNNYDTVFEKSNIFITLVARITWTENDYRAGEAELSVVGIIQTSAMLARDVTLRVRPLTYSQAMAIDDIIIPVNLPTAARRKYLL